MVTDTAEIEATVGVREVITVREYDAAQLRDIFPEWDDLEAAERIDRLDEYDVDPVREHVSDNTTCVGLHELLVDRLDGSNSAATAVTHLGVGTDNTTPQVSDETLGNQVAKVEITSFSDDGATLTTRTHLDTKTANGYSLVEGGLLAQGTLCNRSLFASSIEKTDNVEATVTAKLSFAAQ